MLPHDDPPLKIRPVSNQNIPRIVETFANNIHSPQKAVETDHDDNSHDPDTFPVESFDPTQFALPTAIPINREGMMKSRRPSSSTSTGKSASIALIQKAAKGLYTYRSIRSDQVRLLVIKPSDAPNCPLNATLKTFDDSELENGKQIYTALSYNWGDSEADHTIIIQSEIKARPISSLQDLVDDAMAEKLSDSRKMLIRHNLYDALKELRRASCGKHLFIWVDAICINQNDDTEKQEQVMKMASIYHNSKSVCIWLGTDTTESRVSDRAMQFIPRAINPNNYQALLSEPEYIPQWASLFELLRWSWFSRRWVIQELALARYATVHCGSHTINWEDFHNAIAIFCASFDVLKGRLREYFRAHFHQRNKYLDSAFEIEQFGAKLLVDITSDLFRKESDGQYDSTINLETLVCSLSNFDTSDPRDTINAFLNICKESNSSNKIGHHTLPKPDYSKDLLQVYREFVKYVVDTSKSLNIICRYWALPERETKTPTTPRLVQLPTWILLVDDSAFGRGEEVYHGRKAADSLVGLPGASQYNASGSGWLKKDPQVIFPEDPAPIEDEILGGDGSNHSVHKATLIVTGVAIGIVSFRNQPFADGVIPRDCLEKLGWNFDWKAKAVKEVPDQLWRTLVADRGPKGQAKPKTYRLACQHCLVSLTRNGHMNIKEVLRKTEDSNYTKDYLERVLAVTWDRSFIEGLPILPEQPSIASEGRRSSAGAGKKLVGLGPRKTQEGDIIAILYGCSVPVILRPVTGTQDHEFVGEAYIHGKMDGEAISEYVEKTEFRLI
ncbi:hypothetical protein HBI38_023360 [Parastagonospora nodorum]|nr:hypothetical protein HBH61_031960 [Parastagonospora nodorum]KAH5032604.1 hypothetical protein HBI75_108910 [Parastagonospora nodorum]KAH5088128.1 hypothetical protein HBI73_136470 [Parastagonospora nodorum]KAH5615742.1 hypothetical protein HBI45_024710 [Parastagonospora nodorum]KAH5655452.1 hypothetical protein HBI51_045060 [Parastagonospora nodorum]